MMTTDTSRGSLPTARRTITARQRRWFQDRAIERALPLSLRVAFLAYARRPNCGVHARFADGEIATTLRASELAVRDAIMRAVITGLIEPRSRPTCVIVPPDLASIRTPDRCAVHDGPPSRVVAGQPPQPPPGALVVTCPDCGTTRTVGHPVPGGARRCRPCAGRQRSSSRRREQGSV